MAVARDVCGEASVIGVSGSPGRAHPGEGDGADIRYAPPDYAELVRHADVVVCGAGQTLIETAATGTPAVAVLLGDDQRRQWAAVSAAGACAAAGSWEMAAAELDAGVREALMKLQPREVRLAMANRARHLVDGSGAARIAAEIVRLADARAAVRARVPVEGKS
jgi:UDP-N-acetylglucosamine:LPS N-acetylglucosamine transferase